MPRPVCGKCELEMRPERNGIYVVFHDAADNPYKIWCGDLYKCPKCGLEVVTGWGECPIRAQGQTDFQQVLGAVEAEPHKHCFCR